MAFNVLIVEDQAMPRQLFADIIHHADNYTLVAAIDTAETADIYCASSKVDLILMDVVMSDGSNGLEAAARIKRSYPSIRIIIVTSMPDAAILEKAKNIGVDSFWYKEVQEVPILEIMDRTMRGEHVFPDRIPMVRLGLAGNGDFTAREMDVLRLLASGYTDKEISEKLFMSFHTVRFHINNLLGKTGCASRTSLALLAVKSGIIVPDLGGMET